MHARDVLQTPLLRRECPACTVHADPGVRILSTILERSAMRPPISLLYASTCCLLVSASLHAQAAAIHPAKQQIAEAVTALPEELRAGAAVLGYSPEGKLVPLREAKK